MLQTHISRAMGCVLEEKHNETRCFGPLRPYVYVHCQYLAITRRLCKCHLISAQNSADNSSPLSVAYWRDLLLLWRPLNLSLTFSIFFVGARSVAFVQMLPADDGKY